MGMRIHGGGGGYSAGAQDAQWQQRRQNFDALAQAISAGNLSNANDAYSKITSSMPAGAQVNPNGFIAKVGAALQSGDITTAQQILAARFNGDGAQTSAASSTQQTGSVTTASATTAAGTTSATGAASGRHGHHHHHGGGGGSSPALDLSQAIQSGDSAKAQSSMQTILTDLQQVASMGSMSTNAANGTATNSTVTAAVTAANNLLQNPDFQALEDAVAKGDATGMQSAWSKLISGATASSAASTAASTTAATSAASTSSPSVV